MTEFSTRIVTADHLKAVTDKIDMEKVAAALASKRKEDEEREKLREDFMNRNLRNDGADRFNAAVERAAAAGQSEIQILTFPAEYCTDHGRAINNFEEGWQSTLTGYAKKISDAYDQYLKPNGFKINARILNYPDGNLGEVGLYISW